MHLLATATAVRPQKTITMLGSQLWLTRARVGYTAPPIRTVSTLSPTLILRQRKQLVLGVVYIFKLN